MKKEIMSRKGKITTVLYLFSLAWIAVFGFLYFGSYGVGWQIIIALCFFFSLAFVGAYFGKTAWQKIGLVLVFGGIFGLIFAGAFSYYTLSPQRIEGLIQQVNDPNETVQIDAIEGLNDNLEFISDSIHPKVVESLINALEDDNPSVRWRAADTLGKIGDPMAVEALINALGDEDTSVRNHARSAIVEIGGPVAVDALINTLGDEERVSYAVETLGEIGDASAVEPLINVLEEGSYNVQNGAIVALGKIGDIRAAPALVKCLMDYSTSTSIVGALEQIGWQPESEEEQVRFYIAKKDSEALLGIWSQTKEVLLNDMKTEDPSCVKYAIRVFVALGNEEIIPSLVANLNGSNSKTIAEIYLNCGCNELENAAVQWAHAHGYTITHSYGSASAIWGSW